MYSLLLQEGSEKVCSHISYMICRRVNDFQILEDFTPWGHQSTSIRSTKMGSELIANRQFKPTTGSQQLCMPTSVKSHHKIRMPGIMAWKPRPPILLELCPKRTA